MEGDPYCPDIRARNIIFDTVPTDDSLPNTIVYEPNSDFSVPEIIYSVPLPPPNIYESQTNSNFYDPNCNASPPKCSSSVSLSITSDVSDYASTEAKLRGIFAALRFAGRVFGNVVPGYWV